MKDKQMDQWNVRPPLLYLWSRRDWADKHKVIAQEHGHLWPRKLESEEGKTFDTSRARQPEESKKGKSSDLSRHWQQEDSGKGKGSEVLRPKQLESEKGQRSKTSDDHIHVSDTLLADEPEGSRNGSVVSEVHKSGYSKTTKRDSDRESHDSREHRTNLSPEAPSKRKRFEEKARRGEGESSEESTRDVKKPSLNEIYQGPHASPNVSDHKYSLDGFLSKSVEMPPFTEVGVIGHQQMGLTMLSRNTNLVAAYDAARSSSTDDIARKYNLNAEEPNRIGTSGWSNNVSPISDIGSRHFEERIINQMRGHVDGLNYKPYTSGPEGYMGDSEIRSHIHRYGHSGTDNLRSNYQAGLDPGYSRIGSFPATYGHLGAPPESSYWSNTSAMQRYAPRLDELNHTRLGGMGAAHQLNGSSAIDPRAHLPSGYRGAPQGFASGPQYPYSNHNSAGWLNE